MEKIILGVDLGGTRLRLLAGKGENGQLMEKKVVDSPFRVDKEGKIPLDSLYSDYPLPERTSLYLRDRLLEFCRERGYRVEDIEGVGISVPGRIRENGGFFGGNTPERTAEKNSAGQWEIDVKKHLEPAFGEGEIEIENDCRATARFLCQLYSHWGKDPHSVYYITISTGIGGGSLHEIPNEFGHQFSPGSLPQLIPPCGCGGRGCVEAYASGSSLVRRLERLAALEKNESLLSDFEEYESLRWGVFLPLKKWIKESPLVEKWREGKGRVTGAEIFSQARKHRQMAGNLSSYLVLDGARRIGEASVNIAQLLGLEVICVGGGVAEENDFFVHKINEVAQSHLGEKNTLLGNQLEIIPTPVGAQTSDYGCLALVGKIDPQLFRR